MQKGILYGTLYVSLHHHITVAHLIFSSPTIFKMALASAEVKAWCIQELLKIMDDEDLVTEKVLSMNDVSQLETYLRSVLDPRNSEHRDILTEFNNVVETCGSELMYSQKCSGEFIFGTDPPPFRNENKSMTNSGKELKKKPAKFVPLYGAEGQARSSVRLPGRHPCECLGQKHQLINNCIECGRIVCMQEGSGPCYFCGALVCSTEEKEILSQKSKKSQKLYEKLLTRSIEDTTEETLSVADKGLQEAIAHKNKLIEFDKSGVRRTKVIDDECDYFASDSNRWLSKRERDALRKKEEDLREKRHGSRRQMKVTLDFAGRRVIDEKEVLDYDRESDVAGSDSSVHSLDVNHTSKGVANPSYGNVASLKFVPSTNKGTSSNSTTFESSMGRKSERETMRIQDKEFQEMSDTGACLSMHQPWASLLVMGIKRVEGRTWYTAHRGRLWIASTAKQTSEHDIKVVENMYKALYGNERITFPKFYPSSCLLGCVDVMDCLAQEDYSNEFPEGESDSPFVFVCENPQQLTVKFPVKGQHKIWKLDHAIHKAAKGGLRKAA